MATSPDRWGIVYSSHTGSFNTHKRWKLIRQYMSTHGVQYDFVQSEGLGSVERLSKMLCDNGYRTLVVVGGDGSLNEAINGVMRCDNLAEGFALAVIPNGIGNDFSHFWGHTEDDYKANIDAIIARRTRRIDVGCCLYSDEDNVPIRRYFLNCVNIGLGARMVEISEKFKRLIGSKRLSLIPVLIAQVFERKSFKMQLKVDTEEIDKQLMSVCVGNCTGYGQTPNAVPYNSLLDMSLITRPQWWQLLEGFWLLGKGRFLNYKNVSPYRLQTLEVRNAGKAKISLDGRMLQGKKLLPMKISVIADRIEFII